MSNTQTVPVQAHALVRRVGARSGSWHAALLEHSSTGKAAWRTACGELLEDGPRGVMVALHGAAAHEEIGANPQLLCRRCDRVGQALG